MRYLRFVLVLCLLTILHLGSPRGVPHIHALDFYDYIQLSITPIPCSTSDTVTCPLVYGPDVDPNLSFQQFYKDFDPSRQPNSSYNTFKTDLIRRQEDEFCANRYEPPPTPEPDAKYFTQDPRSLHFWAEDQEVTALGKAVDRSRQFIYWTITSQAVDQSLSLKQIWSMNRNIALGFMIVITAALGFAIALSLRLRSGYKFSAQGALAKVGLSILYIALSASIVFSLIALSEVLMKFFIETLGGSRVFNTYFGATSSEANYVGFYGCRDLNIRVQEAADTQMFVLKLSIITNYMMGVMFILRKIILWFLLLVSPFLPLLLAFPLIRNTGKIWIGVFFQWLFYGPLFALFFGATAKLFQDGIPFIFDFSRIERSLGYIFPTAIRITYGGPAQQLSGLNNANYIDTFAEYIISLVLWWAATWFPWWLLRIFRDDCCDGIYAIKNALYGFLDKPAKPLPPGPTPPNRPPTFDTPPPLEPLQTRPEEVKRVDTRDTRTSQTKIIRLDNTTAVRQAKTTDIMHTLSLRATTLKDVARLETTSTLAQTARQNLALLANPLTAQTASDRQKFLNLRTELFTRASTRNDSLAQYILSTTATSSQAYVEKRHEIAKSMESVVQKVHTQQPASLAQISAQSFVTSSNTFAQVSTTQIQSIVQNEKSIQNIVNATKVPPSEVKEILQTYALAGQAPQARILQTIVDKTQIAKERVSSVVHEATAIINKERMIEATSKVLTNIMHNEATIQSIAAATQTTKETARQVLTTYLQHVDSTFTQVVDRISETTGINKEKIVSILQQTKHIVAKAQSMRQLVQRTRVDQSKISDLLHQISTVTADTTQVTAQQTKQAVSSIQQLFESTVVATYTKELLKHSSTDAQLISVVQQNTGLSKKQIVETITSLAEAPSILDQTVLTQLQKDVGVSVERVLQIVRETITHGQAVNEIAKPTTQQEQSIVQAIEEQLETATNPNSAVDETISLDDSASLEEYNEIRTLWVEQYRTGEVPISDQIHSRLEWVEQDSVLIADILTRLVSQDEKEREAALDDIGYILPVFLMNNLSGTQLITYLKAKLSAAKEVRVELIAKSNSEAELEEVERNVGPAEENTKHMELDDSGEAKTVEADATKA